MKLAVLIASAATGIHRNQSSITKKKGKKNIFVYYMAAGPLGTLRRTSFLRRKPVRQVHRPKKNYTPRPLPGVSPKSLKTLTAEMFWNKTPIRGQRYIKLPSGMFLNEHNFYTTMKNNLNKERNKRAAQTKARQNEAARRIQQAWRHTKQTHTPQCMQSMYIMQVLYRTHPGFKQLMNNVNMGQRLRTFNLTPSEVTSLRPYIHYYT